MKNSTYKLWLKILGLVGIGISVLTPLLSMVFTLGYWLTMLPVIGMLAGLLIGILMVYNKNKFDQMTAIVLLVALALPMAIAQVPYIGSLLQSIMVNFSLFVAGTLVIPVFAWGYNKYIANKR